MTLFHTVSDIFLPRCCIICGRPLYRFERHIFMVCLYDLPRTYFWMNRYNQMAQSFNALLQTHIQKEETLFRFPVRYVYAAALFFYTGDSYYRQITRSLKYGYDLSSGRYFSHMFATYLRQCSFLEDVDLIAPVPLHKRRRWSRGYNQAQVIAEELSKSLDWPCIPDFLIRTRMTRTQTRLSVEEKHKNVENAFRVNSSRVEDLLGLRYRHLVLVDDVFTTGAT